MTFKKTKKPWPWKKTDDAGTVIRQANALAKKGKLTPDGLESASALLPDVVSLILVDGKLVLDIAAPLPDN